MSDIPELLPDERLCGDTTLVSCQLVLLRMLRIVEMVCREHGIGYWLDGGTLLGAVRHHGFIPWDDDIDIVMPREDYNRFLKIAPELLPKDMYVQTNELDSNYERYGMPCKIRDRYSRIREGMGDKCKETGMGLFIDIVPMDKFHTSKLAFKRDYVLKWLYRKLCVLPYAVLMPHGGIRAHVNNTIVRLRPLVDIKRLLLWYRNYLRNNVVVSNNKMTDNYLIGYGFDSYWFRFFDPKDIFPLQEISFEGYQFYAPANTDAVLKTFYGDYMQLPPKSERKPSHMALLDIDIRLGDNERNLGSEAY